MNFKLAIGITLGLTLSAAVAEARSNAHLYGSVPVAGDPHLTIAYNNAKAWCGVELHGTYGNAPEYRGHYGPAAMRNCLARYGFVYHGSAPYAYPVRKVVFITK